MGDEDPKFPTRVDPATGLEINRYDKNDRGSGLRNRRVRAVGPKRETYVRAPKRALVLLQAEGDDVGGYERPTTRADCEKGGANEHRPCPFVSCRHHTYLDVTRSGGLTIHRPDEEVWEMTASCALDVADHGGVSLEVVGAAFNFTRERARQVEERALRKILVVLRLQGREGEIRELLGELAEQDHDSPLASAEEK